MMDEEMFPDIKRYTDEELCDVIARETTEIMDFWKYNSEGWVPAEVAHILTRSMLDWQSSLAQTLKIWIGRESEGEGAGSVVRR